MPETRTSPGPASGNLAGVKSLPLTLLQVLELSAASEFHFSATPCVCETGWFPRPSWQSLTFTCFS